MDKVKKKKALSLALKYLALRSRSETELKTYLDRKNFERDVITSVLNELKSYGYINDIQFTKDFVNYHKLKGHGIKKIRYELQLKIADGNIIDEVISELFSLEDEFKRAKCLIEKREGKTGSIDEKWIKRQAAYLQRRGFESNIIFKVLKDYNPSE